MTEENDAPPRKRQGRGFREQPRRRNSNDGRRDRRDNDRGDRGSDRRDNDRGDRGSDRRDRGDRPPRRDSRDRNDRRDRGDRDRRDRGDRGRDRDRPRRDGGGDRDRRPRREGGFNRDDRRGSSEIVDPLATPPEAPPEGAKPPLVADRKVVVPGQIICEGLDYLPSDGTYRREDKVLSEKLGVVVFKGRLVSVVPIAGRYLPREGDIIIGRVKDLLISGWRFEINSAYSAVLNIANTTGYIRKGEDLTKYYALGDYVSAKVTQVTSQNLIDISMKGPGLRKLSNGRIVELSPAKVPRLLATNGGLLDNIKKLSGCDLAAGMNGLVWMQGSPENEQKVVETIRLVDEEGHLPGLSDKVEALFSGKKPTSKAPAKKEDKPKAEKKTAAKAAPKAEAKSTKKK